MDPDPAIFIIVLQDANKNKKIFKTVQNSLLLFEGTFTSFFRDKKSKRSHKGEGIKNFLSVFA
jgi:hypothetical protein